MKIIFFNIFDDEISYYKNNCPSALEQVYFNETLDKCTFTDYDFSDADYLCVNAMSKLSSENLLRFPNLKFIFTRSMGFDHIDLDYCKNHSIRVFNTPHYGDRTVAEFAFALLLNISKKIFSGAEKLRNPSLKCDLKGFELHNKTLGIAGLGSIGERIANIAQGFGMRVFAYDKIYKENYKYLPFEKLLSVSDIISINCPLNSETKYLFDKSAFNNMKKGTVIINVARGEIIDTKALIDALESGIVSYAGIDVVECESITYNAGNKNFNFKCTNEPCYEKHILNQKLLSLPNVIMTPHMAYLTGEALLRINEITIKNIDCCVKNDYNLCLNNQVLI